MNGNELETLILKAAEEAENMKNNMNEEEAKDSGRDSWSEYEATFKAMFYHQLIENGLVYQKISMENHPDVKEGNYLEKKKIDIWIEETNDDYLIEVKLIGVDPTSQSLKKVYDKSDSLKVDLVKLTNIINYYKDGHTFGIAIAVYDGDDSNIDCDYMESRLNKDVTKLLSPYVRIIVCANRKCKYVQK